MSLLTQQQLQHLLFYRPVVRIETSSAKRAITASLLLFLKKSSATVVRHNPQHASYIFHTIFTAVLLDCLKQTYQIFKTAIFQDVSEDLIRSYDLFFLFPSI